MAQLNTGGYGLPVYPQYNFRDPALFVAQPQNYMAGVLANLNVRAGEENLLGAQQARQAQLASLANVDRSFDRQAFESDRAFERGVLESDRQARLQVEQERRAREQQALASRVSDVNLDLAREQQALDTRRFEGEQRRLSMPSYQAYNGEFWEVTPGQAPRRTGIVLSQTDAMTPEERALVDYVGKNLGRVADKVDLMQYRRSDGTTDIQALAGRVAVLTRLYEDAEFQRAVASSGSGFGGAGRGSLGSILGVSSPSAAGGQYGQAILPQDPFGFVPADGTRGMDAAAIFGVGGEPSASPAQQVQPSDAPTPLPSAPQAGAAQAPAPSAIESAMGGLGRSGPTLQDIGARAAESIISSSGPALLARAAGSTADFVDRRIARPVASTLGAAIRGLQTGAYQTGEQAQAVQILQQLSAPTLGVTERRQLLTQLYAIAPDIGLTEDQFDAIVAELLVPNIPRE